MAIKWALDYYPWPSKPIHYSMPAVKKRMRDDDTHYCSGNCANIFTTGPSQTVQGGSKTLSWQPLEDRPCANPQTKPQSGEPKQAELFGALNETRVISSLMIWSDESTVCCQKIQYDCKNASAIFQ